MKESLLTYDPNEYCFLQSLASIGLCSTCIIASVISAGFLQIYPTSDVRLSDSREIPSSGDPQYLTGFADSAYEIGRAASLYAVNFL